MRVREEQRQKERELKSTLNLMDRQMDGQTEIVISRAPVGDNKYFEEFSEAARFWNFENFDLLLCKWSKYTMVS